MPGDSSPTMHSPQKPAEPFFYRSVNGQTSDKLSRPPAAASQQLAATTAETKAPMVGDTRSYEKGLADGEARARASFDKALSELRSQVAITLREFSAQREAYFEKVETEVVKLTLSIARKVLHRESQMDPMLLTGVVRVALEGLNEQTHARLHTHPEEVRLWRDYFSHATDIRPIPEVLGDTTLSAGNCRLETDLGSTNISFETQLKEIEQGFLDLLDQRPRGA